MKKKIVITGISSTIIQKLAAHIDFSKYEVIGISRNPSFTMDNMKIIIADISELNGDAPFLKDCFMLIHGAAITHSRNEKAYYNVNLSATIKLIEAVKKYSVQRFVFISSNTAGKKSGAYGLTKFLAEQQIQNELKEYSIIRLAEVYGGDKKEGIDKLITDVLNKSVVFCPTGMPSKLSPIHIDDVAIQLYKSIFSGAPNIGLSVINGPEKFTYKEFIEIFKNASKRKLKVFYLSKKIMYLIKWVVKISPVNVGIVPDQVDRLYGEKHIEENPTPMMTMSEYVAIISETKDIKQGQKNEHKCGHVYR